MFKKLNLSIDAERVLSAPRTLVQVSDNGNRKRYKYTEWKKETHPGTPLLMYKLPKDITDEVIQQLPKELIAREVPGVFLMVIIERCITTGTERAPDPRCGVLCHPL